MHVIQMPRKERKAILSQTVAIYKIGTLLVSVKFDSLESILFSFSAVITFRNERADLSYQD